MKTKIEEDIDKIENEVKNVGDYVGEIYDLSISSLKNIDITKQYNIKNMDLMIYHKIKSIESQCINVLLLDSPLAKDLRRVFTFMEVLSDIDRIARYSYDISLLIPKFTGQQHFEKIDMLMDMANLTRNMIINAIKSLVEEDIQIAEQLTSEDDKVDEMFENIIEVSNAYMKETPSHIDIGLYYPLIAKYLERMADHSVNIGDRVVYMISGKKILKI
ncbi:MAG: phosphate signaling complex protein PhoU [Thermoplasmata archaeon]